MSVFFVYVIQAYTSQFVALAMFGLMMSEDRLSLQQRRLEIINSLRDLPGQSNKHQSVTNTKPFMVLTLAHLIFKCRLTDANHVRPSLTNQANKMLYLLFEKCALIFSLLP